jgi:PAS domain S-box-containing protein
MKSGVRNRVLLVALLPAMLVALLLGSTFLATRLDDLDTTLRARAWALAREIAAVADFAIFAGNDDSLRNLAQAALSEPGVRAIVITDGAGTTLARAGVSVLPTPPHFDGSGQEFLAAADQVSVIVFPITRSRVNVEDFYSDAAAAPAARSNQATVGNVIVEMSRDSLLAEKRNLILAGLAITLSGLALGALLAVHIARTVTRPIVHVGEIVERIGRGELDARVVPDPDRTLERLEQGVNNMAVRLASAHELMAEKIAEATADLRRSEERLSLVISGTSDGVWDWDLLRNEVYFSRRFQELLGYDNPEEFHLQFFFFSAALHPDDSDRALAAQAEHLRNGTPYDAEFRLRCKDGDYRWFRGRGQALWDDFGKPCRFAGSITDITTQKAAAELLRRRKEEAERATLAKTRFLAAASHDLRQPMHALGMFVSRLSRHQHPAEIAEVVTHIESSVIALQDLLDALLDISKLDAGAMTPNVRTFAADELLGRLATEFAGPAGEKGLRLIYRPAPIWLKSDPLLLERIVTNLVVNAIRYTRSGTVFVACRRRGAAIRVEVRDSGIGIPLESQQEIFEEFVQLANPERAKGLGLGLAICSRLAHLLGHSLGVRSAPGRGSVFWVDVTAGQPADLPSDWPAPVALPNMQLEDITVAVVDDDDTARAATQSLLESWGSRVIAAVSGAELLRLCEASSQPPRLAICDYRLLDGETGIAVAAELRARYGAAFPCVLVSGDTNVELSRDAAEHKLPLLHKPVRPAKLRALLQRLLAASTA